MCRGTQLRSSSKTFALANPPATFKNRKSDLAEMTQSEKENCHAAANCVVPIPVKQTTFDAPSFEIYFNPTIPNSTGCLRACRDAIFESCPEAKMSFVSVRSSDLSNKASHIVISCVELDGISLIQHQIAPCEIIRMEQRLMNSDNSTWCLAFRGLVALKIASRLTKVRQSDAVKQVVSKLRSEEANSTNLPPKNAEPEQKSYKARQNPIFGFSQDDVRNSYTRQLDKLYKHYCPVKRHSVPMLLQQYHGREEYLLRKVKSKYSSSKQSSRQAIYV